MNENRKLRVIIAVLISILVLVPTIVLFGDKKNKEYIDNLKEIMEKSTPTVFYIARPTCYYCNLLEPITTGFKESYGINYHMINTDEISSTLLKRILKLLDIETDKFGTPYLAIVQNGQVIGRQSGYDNEQNTFSFLQEYGIIDNSQKLWYQTMSTEQLSSAKENSNKTYILIGNDREEATRNAKEILKSIVNETSVTIYYVEIGGLSSTSTIETATGFTAEQLKQPIFFATENGNITAASNNTKEAYTNLIK